MACIYKITNLVNGKSYIGSTIRPLYKRKYEHFSELRNNEHCNTYLQRSFNKYGEKNFKFEILEILKFPETYSKLLQCEYLVCRELYLVDLFDAEYNMRKDTTTGNAGYHHSKETCIKISDGHLKRREWITLSDSTLEKIDREKRRLEGKLITQLKRLKPIILKKEVGRPKDSRHTPEAIEKIRQRSSQEDNRLRMRELQKINANNRIGTHVREDVKINTMFTKFGISRVIEIYTKDGILFDTCNFSPEASIITGVSRSSISNNLVGISKFAGEYIFKYKNIA